MNGPVRESRRSEANALLVELGSRVCRDIGQENVGKPRWRIMAIVLRHYDQYQPGRRG